MNEQEAIKIIDCNRPYEAIIRKAEKEVFDMAIKSLEKQSIYEQIKWERDVALEQLESIGVGLGRIMDDVKEAMEKQISKKPDIEGDGYDTEGNLVYDTWICPNCEERYEIDYDDYDYCPKCGQAIDKSVMDWNDEE